jgi:hypothetical protein
MLVCVAWLVFELYQADPFWTMMAVLATGWAAWDFFLSGNYGGSKPGASP